MEYVVPLIIVLVIVVAVVVGNRMVGRRGRAEQGTPQDASASAGITAASRKPARRGREITRESAAAASVRLTPEMHRAIYSLIAQNQVLNAVQTYRKATRSSLGESAAAIAALAQFPQPTPEPAQQPTPEPGPESAPAAAEEVALTVEDIINAAPAAQGIPAAASKYRYRAIVTRGDEVREVASTRLNEEIFSQIRLLAQGGNYDGAARLLCEHADIGVADALEFVSMIEPAV